jgi:hypothetical protein
MNGGFSSTTREHAAGFTGAITGVHGGVSGTYYYYHYECTEGSPASMIQKQQECTEESPAPALQYKKHAVGIHRCPNELQQNYRSARRNLRRRLKHTEESPVERMNDPVQQEWVHESHSAQRRKPKATI